MKILPSYLIEYMPYLEDAMEELRLSVYDHAFDLLKALDIDELTSDDIRHKLELYDIKIENMSESWLPNGRFYRIYPSIRYNRTRLNALQSVVKSGGQFEGLWSSDFSNKTEFNYKYIQMLRHYMASSPVDGYFYISGDTAIINDGTVSSSAVTALSSDILVDQAMPAGYTYLYVPWPVPHYPTDAGSFYNPHMLLSDRPFYCTYYDSESYDPDAPIISWEIPASVNYDWEYGSNTPYRMPYWLDYHYMNDMRSDSGKWPLEESGTYKDADGNSASPQDAIAYTVNPSCDELVDSESVFPTQCWTVLTTITTPPCISEEFYITSFNINYDIPSEIEVIDNSIDQFCPDSDGICRGPGPYRADVLSTAYYNLNEVLGHIKVSTSLWSSATTPIYSLFNMYSVGQDSTLESRKLYYWMHFDSNGTYEGYVSIDEYTDYINPFIHIEEAYRVLYTNPVSGILDHDQGDNKEISSTVLGNKLFAFGEDDTDDDQNYDPTLSYKLVAAGVDDYGYQQFANIENCYLEGDPSTGLIYLNKNGSPTISNLNYVTYKTSKVHKLWFSSSKDDVTIDSAFSKLYNENGNDEIYYYGGSNTKAFNYNIIGLYNSDGSPVDCDLTGYTFNCYLSDDKYNVLLRILPIIEEDVIEYDTNSPQWETADSIDYPSLSGDYVVFKGKVDPTVVTATLATLSFDLDPSSYNNGWVQWVSLEDDPSTTCHTLPSGAPSTALWKIFESYYDSSHTDSVTYGMEITVDASSSVTIPVKLCQSSEQHYDYVTVFIDGTQERSLQDTFETWVDLDLVIPSGSHTIKIKYSKDSSQSSGSDCGWFAIGKATYDSGKIEDTVTTTHTATLDIGFNIESSELYFPIKISHSGDDSSEHVNVYIDGIESVTHSTQNTWTDLDDISLLRGSHSISIKYDKYTGNSDDYGFVAIPSNLIDTSTMSKTITHSYIPSLPSFNAAYILFTVDVTDGAVEPISYTNIEMSSTVIPYIAYGTNIPSRGTVQKAIRFSLGNIDLDSSDE
jgi:hypothetical protein